jgi:hypothetical protein
MLWTLIESFFYVHATWTDFYGDITEELPPNMPELWGHPNAPIIWFLQKQNTVKAAIFGSEFVALQICKEMIVAF